MSLVDWMLSILSPKPKQLSNFLEFCKYKESALKTNKLDLSHCNWVFPSTLLPLGVFIKNNPSIGYFAPTNDTVANYVSLMIGRCTSQSECSFIPIAELPKNQEDTSKLLEKIYRLQNNGEEYGGEGAFKYLINELTDNIYQHSEFKNAFVMPKDT